jgi:hypothetical protein
MIGIFIFKAKPEDKAYKYKKEPKQPLKLTDEELVHFVKTTPKMTYFCYHRADRDKLSDEDKILSTKEHWDDDYSSFKKMRGCENSYQTDDGNYFIKVITKGNDWFSQYFC